MLSDMLSKVFDRTASSFSFYFSSSSGMATMTGTSNPRAGLSRIACNRLQKELVEWQVNPPAGFKHRVTDNLQRWIIEVTGAPGTLYANESYQLQVDFPEHYPMESPRLFFFRQLLCTLIYTAMATFA